MGLPIVEKEFIGPAFWSGPFFRRGFGQSGSSSETGRFSNDWKKVFQWLEKRGDFYNDWKNFSLVSSDWKSFYGNEDSFMRGLAP